METNVWMPKLSDGAANEPFPVGSARLRHALVPGSFEDVAISTHALPSVAGTGDFRLTATLTSGQVQTTIAAVVPAVALHVPASAAGLDGTETGAGNRLRYSRPGCRVESGAELHAAGALRVGPEARRRQR